MDRLELKRKIQRLTCGGRHNHNLIDFIIDEISTEFSNVDYQLSKNQILNKLKEFKS